MTEREESSISDRDKVVIYLEEFKSYRAEIIANQDGYIKIFTIGAAAAGALLALVFGKNTADGSQFVIMLIVILILIASLITMKNLYYHTESIADYVKILERRINDLAKTEMNWEHEQKDALKKSLRSKLFPCFNPTLEAAPPREAEPAKAPLPGERPLDSN